MPTKVYNGDEVIVVFGPVLIQSGRGPEEFVRIESESNITEDDVGVDGEVVVSRSQDKRATITITLMQTAAANAELSVIANTLRNAPSGIGGFHPVLIKDLNGVSLHTAINGWIQKEPDVAYAKAPGTREWELRVATLVRADGGNFEPSA